jgi:cholesterol oxidase
MSQQHTGNAGAVQVGETHERYDFVIIGSGFGGSVSALRLAEKGYRVAVLEAGKRWAPEDFPETNWNIRKHLWMPRIGLHGILRMNVFHDTMVLAGAGVGGGSLVYAATLLVPPDPFYTDPQWSDLADWKRALAPHYATAQKMLGVTRFPGMTAADRVMKDCADQIGQGHTFQPTDVGIYFGKSGVTEKDPFFDGRGPDRKGCTMCGGCMIGCRHGSKNTLDKNYLYLAEQLGVKVFPETEATLIRKDAAGYLVDTRVSTALVGGKRTFAAKNVVVSAGVMGTVNLLLKCREKGALPNLSDQLGRVVRTNSEVILGATSGKRDADFTHGVAITSSIKADEVTYIEPVRYSAGSSLMALMSTIMTDGGPGMPRALRWLGNVVKNPLKLARMINPSSWAERTIILLVMQTLDNKINFVRRRRWYFPFVKTLDTTIDAGVQRAPSYIPIANKFGRLVAQAIEGEAGNSLNEVALDIPLTAHILGGCAIGGNAAKGVIDARNEVYGYPGLYVADGSMIPANLGVNPSLTITAMTEHAMERMPAKDSASERKAAA